MRNRTNSVLGLKKGWQGYGPARLVWRFMPPVAIKGFSRYLASGLPRALVQLRLENHLDALAGGLERGFDLVEGVRARLQRAYVHLAIGH